MTYEQMQKITKAAVASSEEGTQPGIEAACGKYGDGMGSNPGYPEKAFPLNKQRTPWSGGKAVSGGR